MMEYLRCGWRRVIPIVVALGVLATSPVTAKSYRIEEISVNTLVQADGGLQVEERLRYRFKGAYSFAFREILLKPGETLEGITVGEDGTAYTESREESPGTYSVSRQSDRVKVTWYFRARNESRTFALQYRMHGVVAAHSDTAELYFQFVGDDWDRPIGRVLATVAFSEPVDPDSLKAWAHGPLHGNVELPGDGTVRFPVAPLPAGTFWEGRVLFPPSVVPGVERVSAEPALDRILAEEKTWAEEANRRREEAAAAEARRRELAAWLLPWSILAAAAGAGLWFFLFWSHGKPHPRRKTFPPGQPPGSLRPAVAAYLMHRDVGGSAIAATLIDLARRGFLRIEETEREKSGWLGVKKVTDYRLERTDKPLSEAAPYERDLVEFTLSEAGDGQALWLSRFKKMASKSRSRFRKWFKQWKKQVKELGKGFFEPYSGSVLSLNIVVGVAVLGFGIYCLVVSQSPVGVPSIVIGTMQAIGSLALTRRTPEGQDLYRAWKEFKAHLKSISKGLGPLSLESKDWGRYLVASIILGMHRDLTKKLDVAPDSETAHAMAWYIPHSGDSSQGLADFGSSISGMVSSVGSAVSSAAGTGGGASAGGGGGSGGGGGGAG